MYGEIHCRVTVQVRYTSEYVTCSVKHSIVFKQVSRNTLLIWPYKSDALFVIISGLLLTEDIIR